MHITDFRPSQIDAERLGLSVDMHRLGRVVVLAGPNGSGKSRTLTVVRESLAFLKQYHGHPDANVASAIAHYTAAMIQTADQGVREQHSIFSKISELRVQLKLANANPSFDIPTAVFAPARVFIDPTNATLASNLKAHEAAKATLGTQSLQAFQYIDIVALHHRNAKNAETMASETEREACKRSWETLSDVVASLSGITLSWDLAGRILGSGRVLGNGAEISEGQRSLLVSAVALHAQTSQLDQAIVFVDEPESHLHPDVLIDYIERLIALVPNGQIWLATHSIHVLAHVHPAHPDSLWFVKDGTVTHSGRRPEDVLKGLVGGVERVGRLQQFLHLPAVYAMERFTAECLTEPAIASTGPEDRQSRQIRDILMRLNDGAALRVLDYGAGTGRILAALREGHDDFATSIDYRAFELNVDARQQCRQAIEAAYGTSEFRLFGGERELRALLKKDSVDVVIMCNTLHEIPHLEWRPLFSRLLLDFLRHDGYLLIVEDMHIPHGEKAHQNGFLLLDTEQLIELFSANPEDTTKFSRHGDDRLKAHLVRAELLRNVTDETVKSALERCRDNARQQVQDLRGTKESSFRNGQLLGLYAMLHVNASLALG